MTPATRTITLIPLPDLIDHPANPKTHDVEAITRSHSTLGTIDLITRDDRTGYTISGHGRTKALRHLHATGEPPPEGIQVADDGTWLVPVVTGWSSKDDDHARAALVTLNTLTEAGGWDPEGLLATLEVLAQADADLLALTLRTQNDITDLRNMLDGPPPLDDLADQYNPDSVLPPSAGHVIISMPADHPTAIKWKAHRDNHPDDTTAVAALLG